jgi:hypothetical protein
MEQNTSPNTDELIVMLEELFNTKIDSTIYNTFSNELSDLLSSYTLQAGPEFTLKLQSILTKYEKDENSVLYVYLFCVAIVCYFFSSAGKEYIETKFKVYLANIFEHLTEQSINSNSIDIMRKGLAGYITALWLDNNVFTQLMYTVLLFDTLALMQGGHAVILCILYFLVSRYFPEVGKITLKESFTTFKHLNQNIEDACNTIDALSFIMLALANSVETFKQQSTNNDINNSDNNIH